MKQQKNKRKLTAYGAWVKKRLIELDMQQKSLAQNINVSESYLADVLRGDKKGSKYISLINDILTIDAKKKLH